MEGIGDPGRVALQQRIVALKLEHRDLDAAIEQMVRDPAHDELSARRMKRRKLLLKDQIARLERQLDPDVPA
ncbi:MAG: YdcH family protein [Burkholderiales bacterium]|nr:YdcH family protein [Burkholderiales bacterium]